MLSNRIIGIGMTLIGVALATGVSWKMANGQGAQPPPVPAQEQPEVLTRGPVHEAFAVPVSIESEAGMIASSQPPPNIQEVPSAQRPEGANIVWVPGYWAWDSDRNNYISVSACWRAAVPNRDWVPGYWWRVSAGWEWVPGFWAEGGAEQIEYHSPPPAMADTRPPGTPPSADVVWVPSCWYWDHDQYILRNGYWLEAQPGWVWVPSHYIRTPRGHVFAAGHWDYSLERRGVLFAPVYIAPVVYTRVGFVYSPSIVVDVGSLTISLFASPRYSHYYFGDYYDESYIRVGIYPWFESERLRTWYDPIYQHDRWRNRRGDPKWDDHRRHDYEVRRDDRNLRPARTYREMEDRVAKAPEPQRRSLQVARPLETVVAMKDPRVRFQAVSDDDRRKFTRQEAEVHKFSQERNKWESEGSHRGRDAPGKDDRNQVTPARPSMPRSDAVDTKAPATAVPVDRRERPAVPTPDRKEPAPSPADTRKPADKAPDNRGAAPAQPDRREAIAPPAETRRPATAAPDRKEPERVKIPTSPISGKPAGAGATDSGPPSRPPDEEKRNTSDRDAGKDSKDSKTSSGDRQQPSDRKPQEDRKQSDDHGKDAKDSKNQSDRKQADDRGKDAKENKDANDRKDLIDRGKDHNDNKSPGNRKDN